MFLGLFVWILSKHVNLSCENVMFLGLFIRILSKHKTLAHGNELCADKRRTNKLLDVELIIDQEINQDRIFVCAKR